MVYVVGHMTESPKEYPDPLDACFKDHHLQMAILVLEDILERVLRRGRNASHQTDNQTTAPSIVPTTGEKRSSIKPVSDVLHAVSRLCSHTPSGHLT